ncbi:hypothetical protein Tco_0628848 [Tanacetum coccineum]|uniref:Uncharacterized protein n=1 Tax=Tanacetum coccineum TaxID=301880 RepID=A0ABQ4WS94_9ASTR
MIAMYYRKDKEPTQEYILLPLHPRRPRIPVEDVIQDAQEKSSKNAPNDKGELDSEDIAAEHALKDDLERMVAQEMAAQAVDDATRQAFEEEKRKTYVSAASTPTCVNAGESSFVYLGGKIPIDASTLPNADLTTDPNMPNLKDVSNAFPNDGIFSGAYDDYDVGAEADFNNMDNTIDVSPIPTLRVYKDHPKGQILGDSKSAVQTRGKIQKASSVQQALVKQQPEGIFISQDKYVADILKKFDFCFIKTATTPIESNKPLVKDEDGVDVDVHIYRSMIGSLMYLTASRPDIMFAVCACARFQVTPKASHLNAVKRIFRYSTTTPNWLWYHRDSPFKLKAFSDSDYGGASLDRKSTTGGCQFLGRRLISWQCKKHTIVANSTTEAEYVAATNFKNHVYHSRTKHIEIRHHFIRDAIKKDDSHWDVKPVATFEGRFTLNSMDLRMDGSCASNFSHIWVTAKVRTLANGTLELVASIDNKEYTITEASVRSKLQLADAAGISNLPDAKIYDGLATLGYVSKGKLTFWKKNFTPQWKFLIHTILHCLSPKSGGWDQFGSPSATALICLSSNRGYAWDYVPLLPTMLAGAAEDQGEGSAIPSEP